MYVYNRKSIGIYVSYIKYHLRLLFKFRLFSMLHNINYNTIQYDMHKYTTKLHYNII